MQCTYIFCSLYKTHVQFASSFGHPRFHSCLISLLLLMSFLLLMQTGPGTMLNWTGNSIHILVSWVLGLNRGKACYELVGQSLKIRRGPIHFMKSLHALSAWTFMLPKVMRGCVHLPVYSADLCHMLRASVAAASSSFHSPPPPTHPLHCCLVLPAHWRHTAAEWDEVGGGGCARREAGTPHF